MDATKFNSRFLSEIGFVGFRPLEGAEDVHIPDRSGIYVVLHNQPEPAFLPRSLGGHFKRKDPTVSLDLLRAKWVSATETLYIGRASSLRGRIRLLVRYGRGEPVAHQGGRYLWQLADHRRLQVAWRLEDDPVRAEATLLEEFERAFGALPFANLVRGTRAAAVA